MVLYSITVLHPIRPFTQLRRLTDAAPYPMDCAVPFITAATRIPGPSTYALAHSSPRPMLMDSHTSLSVYVSHPSSFYPLLSSPKVFGFWLAQRSLCIGSTTLPARPRAAEIVLYTASSGALYCILWRVTPYPLVLYIVRRCSRGCEIFCRAHTLVQAHLVVRSYTTL